MDLETWTTRERGQVGIGTLIVFIAMVLVAAIAAGVLLNTSGALADRAEQTSRDSTDRVSNRLMVVSAYGHVTDEEYNSEPKSTTDIMPNESVDTVELTVKLSPGSGTVNLSQATLSWVGPRTATTLVHGESADYAPGVLDKGNPGTFGLEPDDGDSDDDQTAPHQVFNTYALDDNDHTTLSGQGQRIKIHVNAGLVEAETRDAVTPPYSEPLRGGSEVRLKLTTPSGATTVYRLTVPQSLAGSEFVSL
ncbi:archaellin/type IV pilin N-terminal domain-containing protein [Halorussus pelagicus]|uniref:archaellin/type IV pilin N-terminal domain-containing protein n=1 Tax=Halorussus pelagicus TaxID=2505977 RepID=UPI000FFC0873|nr:archaellin/type IV pilin N-terminal domain-containing protein [Halorussus pelagicus]